MIFPKWKKQGCPRMIFPNHAGAARFFRKAVARKGRVGGCKFARQCVLVVRTRSKFVDVIARSEATRQSASPRRYLASRSYLGRIRGAFRIRLKWCFTFCAAARRTDCHTSSPQSPPCSPPAKGQRGSNAPLGLLSPQRVPLCGAPGTGSQ